MGNLGVKHLFVLSLLLFLGSWYKYSDNYKLVSGTLPETHGTPLQTPLEGPVFRVSHKLASDFGNVPAAVKTFPGEQIV